MIFFADLCCMGSVSFGKAAHSEIIYMLVYILSSSTVHETTVAMATLFSEDLLHIVNFLLVSFQSMQHSLNDIVRPSLC